MGRTAFRKGRCGAARVYVGRKKALRILQLTLRDFRRLCILKGIHPHEPRSRRKAAGPHGKQTQVFYHRKDIKFLLHEPIVNKFRQFKIFARKLATATHKKDRGKARRLRDNYPSYKLDHIVKERYPTFADALRDLDDSLSLCFLFSYMPKYRATHLSIVQMCRRLTVEFMAYVVESRSLRKAFISIKGYYYQAEICGQTVTWVVPHLFGDSTPKGADYKLMATFVEFYTTMLGFVNFKLYNSLNLCYPPKVLASSGSSHDDGLVDSDELATERVAALSLNLRRGEEAATEEDPVIDEFPLGNDVEAIERARLEETKVKKIKSLFAGLKFFIGREVPRESFAFMIRCCGGSVSWDKTIHVGATYEETDETITHQLSDRPRLTNKCMSRYYVQPQWVVDCLNMRTLLPVADYFPGVVLPPHLSPFAPEQEGDYIPPERKKMLDSQKQDGAKPERDDEAGEESEEVKAEEPERPKSGWRKRYQKPRGELVVTKNEMSVHVGLKEPEEDPVAKAKAAADERRMAISMIHKKKKRLFRALMRKKNRKTAKVAKLTAKRKGYDEAIERAKRAKKSILE